jgi:hypothetical protein
MSLYTDFTDYLVVGNTQLILQKEIIFEEHEIKRDCEVSLTEMDEISDLNNGIGIQMDEFDFEMVEETAEEVTAWEIKSPLEESLGHHNIIGVWGAKLLTLCWSPLEGGTGSKKMVGY